MSCLDGVEGLLAQKLLVVPETSHQERTGWHRKEVLPLGPGRGWLVYRSFSSTADSLNSLPRNCRKSHGTCKYLLIRSQRLLRRPARLLQLQAHLTVAMMHRPRAPWQKRAPHNCDQEADRAPAWDIAMASATRTICFSGLALCQELLAKLHSVLFSEQLQAIQKGFGKDAVLPTISESSMGQTAATEALA